MEHKIIHIEIPCIDLIKAKEFYESVFKWKVQLGTGMTEYAFFVTSKESVGGAFYKTDMKAKGEITLYIEVEDIPKILDRITKHGGKITKEKTEIGGDFGFYAIFEDNSGNVMGLWSGK